MWGWILGIGGAAAIGWWMARHHGTNAAEAPEAISALDFSPFSVQKGKLYRFSFLTPADESPDTVNQWLQQLYYVAPKAPPTKVKAGIPLPGPATGVSVDLWTVDAVPLWPAFETPQQITPANYGKMLLANQYPNMDQATDPRKLAALLFMATQAGRDTNEHKLVLFVAGKLLADTASATSAAPAPAV